MSEGLKNRLVATAGHVDHGKTTLLKTLTGTDADRLEEEQQRGLTIDLGFAHMDLGSYRVGFVDVPGHHRFVKNMVTGVGSVQGALFVVSARDGWQQQSREHFQILSLLEPEFICFAVSKIDLVEEDFQLIVEAEIEEVVEDTDYEDAPVVPVSGTTGEGIDRLKTALLESLTSGPEPEDWGKPYLPIDRIFSLEGKGTVVTGSLSGGRIETGDSLELQPAGTRGRVRSIQAYGDSLEDVGPGTRTALNVPDWDPDRVGRGMIGAPTDSGTVTDRADGMCWLPDDPVHRPRHDLTLMAYLGTGRGEAKLLRTGEGTVGDEPEPVRLLWEERVFVRPGDRVILRDFGDQHVLGVVEVLNPAPDRRLQSKSYREFLWSRFPFTVERLVASELRSSSPHRLDELPDGTPFSVDRVRGVLEEMSGIKIEEEFVLREGWLEGRLEELEDRIDRWHRDHPLSPGLPLDESGLPDGAEIRDLIYQRLEDHDLVRENTVIRRSEFEPELSPEQEETLQQILDRLREGGLEAPGRDEFKDGTEELIRFAVHRGDIVDLSDDRLLHREVYDRLLDRIRTLFEEGERLRLSDIRDGLDSSRKYVIPLMEYLDEEGHTHRDGDHRIWVGDSE